MKGINKVVQSVIGTCIVLILGLSIDASLNVRFPWFTVGSLWSLFLAAHAFQIHFTGKTYGEVVWPIKIHQFVLNFLGAEVGFIILYLLIETRYFVRFDDWEKIILLVIAFLSVTGYLPYILIKRGLPWNK